jgi:uncharacterized protein (UPF0305 family)
MNNSITDNKSTFLRYIYAANSIAAALQTRNKSARIYKENYDENLKDKFKKFLLNRTINLWIGKKGLTKQEMLKEIVDLKNECEKDFSSILKDDKFRMGVSQKLICLYAKYLWVSGQLTTPPPLIPYDGVVKGLLGDKSLVDWTVLDDMKEYERICAKIDTVSKGKPAEWELEEWNKSILKV